MTECKISIIVPVYNCIAYLERCVESIIRQNMSAGEFELLLIDDGSNDGSESLCDHLASKYPQIRVFHHSNQGPGAARNVGLESARGEYVLFVDSDDFLQDNVLCRIYSTCTANKLDLLGLSANLLDSSGELIRTLPSLENLKEGVVVSGKEFLVAMRARHRVGLWLYAYRLDFLHRNRIHFPAECSGEDGYFLFITIVLAKRILFENFSIYNYQNTAGSLASNYSEEKLRTSISLNKRLTDFVETLRDYTGKEKVALMRYLALTSFIGVIYSAGSNAVKPFANLKAGPGHVSLTQSILHEARGYYIKMFRYYPLCWPAMALLCARCYRLTFIHFRFLNLALRLKKQLLNNGLLGANTN